jgi:hypothetical protein
VRGGRGIPPSLAVGYPFFPSLGSAKHITPIIPIPLHFLLSIASAPPLSRGGVTLLFAFQQKANDGVTEGYFFIIGYWLLPVRYPFSLFRYRP